MLDITPRKDDQVRRAPSAPWVIGLDDTEASESTLAGAKASALARAASAGLPVLPGLVITTQGTAAISAHGTRAMALSGLLVAWQKAAGTDRALVVRSSSTIEDNAASSMAGRFESVLDVVGWDAFVHAVDEVIASAVLDDDAPAPMAVLVQPMLRPTFGGVLFGADPVTGRTDRLVLTAVQGGPDQLVSGTVDGIQMVLRPSGRKVGRDRGLPGLDGNHRRALAGLAATAAEVFGGPQDIEWAIDDGELVLLQSRPITTLAPPPVGQGPVFGPGPVAETLPGVLSRLEADLWVEPLRDGVAAALRLSGSASARALRRSPLVTIVDDQVAADLELLGAQPKRGLIRKLDPRPGARRLAAAWRVGRLRAALPNLAEEVLAEADGALLDVPDLAELSAADLVAILEATRRHLVNLHAFEVLAGMLAPRHVAAVPTGAIAALHALADGRARGLSDEEIEAATPAVLALLPPRIGPSVALPPVPASLPPVPDGGPSLLVAREALRLRARWVQELAARVAWELGGRLARAGQLASQEAVAGLGLPDLAMVAAGGALGSPPAERAEQAPLPSTFRLSAEGDVVAVVSRGKGQKARGAGGGRGVGEVHHGSDPPDGAVLVVRTLSPDLAPLLPRLKGLVSETGSVLSHLAILARESRVPVVVGVPDPFSRFPEGAVVSVDGSSGEILVLSVEGVAS